MPAVRGTAAARDGGKSERGPRWFDSPPYLELGWSEAGCPRRQTEVGDGGYGGGAARLGRGTAVAEVVVVAESCAEALFIGRERRWRGGAPVAELGGH